VRDYGPDASVSEQSVLAGFCERRNQFSGMKKDGKGDFLTKLQLLASEGELCCVELVVI
jgi:hypothetical protein